MLFFGKKNKKNKAKEDELAKTEQVTEQAELEEDIPAEEPALEIQPESEIEEYIEPVPEAEAPIEEAYAEVGLGDTQPEPAAKKPKKDGFFSRLKDGLSKTRNTFFADLFISKDEKVDDDFFDQLEESMILADMGMNAVSEMVDKLRQELKAGKIKLREDARALLKRMMVEQMRADDEFMSGTEKAVILIVGVNGVGKTTSIGKLSHYYSSTGSNVLIAAADTFRAAADEQLSVWAERTNTPIVKHGEGADPAAVVFDAIASYKAKNRDILICDTAGRLHNKKNLMNELNKIRRVIERELPDVDCEVLLVLDATTGQNAIVQAKAFGEATGITGIILTKLDGTAKGGVALAIKNELNVPVRFVGVGEGVDDLRPFDPQDFVDALI